MCIRDSNSTATTFDVMLGKSPDTSAHTFVSAAPHAVKKQDGTITVNVGIGSYEHKFVSGVTNAVVASSSGNLTAATGTTYDPVSGVLVLEVGSHSVAATETITIANAGLTFTCARDAHATNHTYPRPTDYADERVLPITAVNSWAYPCLLYTSPSPRDRTRSRMPSSA